jgi:glycosyltransferase involved in cell wall biosynthesis
MGAKKKESTVHPPSCWLNAFNNSIRVAVDVVMKVLIVHNRYQEAGGEDTAVANEHALLERNGLQTRLWWVTNDVIAGTRAKIAVAMRTPYSRPARDELARVIADFAPTVVHVHNFFPLLSPSVYDASRAARVAVVQTLHNYRTICAGGLLMRGGHPCEDCVGASPYQAVLHGCYRGSRLGSWAVARMVDTHRRLGTWLYKVDRFIALSAFSKSKFVAAGFPADRIAVKPNFTESRSVIEPAVRAGALYVGRLSVEKGIKTLLRAWSDLDVPLRILGDGPLRVLVEGTTNSGVTLLGWQSPEVVAAEMARAAFLIVPSIWPESFPMVIVEAFCQGLPVIASRIGALAEIIDDGRTGLLFSTGDAEDLAAKVRWAHQHLKEMRAMGAHARKSYEEIYSPVANFRQLIKIYEAAIFESQASVRGR